MTYSKPQKLFAEFFGTFAIVFFAAGAICTDQYLHPSSSGQPGSGLLDIALAYGLAMAIMITALGRISGGHFNPAVTIGFWVTRRLSTVDTVLYTIAQLAGAVSAAYLLRRLPVDIWGPVQLGTPDLANGISRTNGMIFEAILTFFLVLVVFATSVDERVTPDRFAGFAVGLTVSVGVLFGGPLTGAALNPARAFGPALAGNHWTNHGVYWIGPLAGGVLAGWLYDTLFLARK